MGIKNFKRIIAAAIEDEIEACEFYQGVCNQVQDSSLQAIFKALAMEELLHRDMLQGFLDQKNMPDIEEMDEGYALLERQLPKLSLDMKPSNAINLAIQKEERAMKDYLVLAGVSKNKAEKNIFENLARMEQGHKMRLEEISARMNLPEKW